MNDTWCHLPATNDENWLFADEAELVHGIDDGQHSSHSLVLLATGHDEGGEGDVVVLEVCLPLLGIKTADGSVADEEHSIPWPVDVGEVTVLSVEDVIHELESFHVDVSGVAPW